MGIQTLSELGFLPVQGRKIEYQSFTPPRDGPSRSTIVLLHEGLGSVAMWKDFPVQLAAATGAQVFAYSRFGYGRSDPAPKPYHALQMHRAEALDVLPEVIDSLGLHRPILFGHSDGASIALMYAGANPRLVAGLVVLAPHVFVEDLCIASIEEARRSYLTTDLKLKLARYHNDPDRAFWSWNNIWLDPAFRAWNIEQDLRPISCPVLAAQGYEDEYGTMEQLERLRHAIPCLQSLKLRGCRHSPHRDRPEAVLRAVAAWEPALTPQTQSS